MNIDVAEEIEQYSKEEEQEILKEFNLEGFMDYIHIIKYDDSQRDVNTLTCVCQGEDLTHVLEWTLRYGCEVTSINLFEESHNVLFGSFNHEAKFKITLQNKYGEI